MPSIYPRSSCSTFVYMSKSIGTFITKTSGMQVLTVYMILQFQVSLTHRQTFASEKLTHDLKKEINVLDVNINLAAQKIIEYQLKVEQREVLLCQQFFAHFYQNKNFFRFYRSKLFSFSREHNGHVFVYVSSVPKYVLFIKYNYKFVLECCSIDPIIDCGVLMDEPIHNPKILV